MEPDKAEHCRPEDLITITPVGDEVKRKVLSMLDKARSEARDHRGTLDILVEARRRVLREDLLLLLQDREFAAELRRLVHQT